MEFVYTSYQAEGTHENKIKSNRSMYKNVRKPYFLAKQVGILLVTIHGSILVMYVCSVTRNATSSLWPDVSNNVQN